MTVEERLTEIDLLGAIFLLGAIINLLNNFAAVNVPPFHLEFSVNELSLVAVYFPVFFRWAYTLTSSGIRTIPYLGSVIVSSILAGASIIVLRFYKPFMIATGAVFTVGAGLIYTLQVGSSV
ncbi:hypothetical protein sscle_13g094890 [Sclerotinia sclerotiorum 1980 UF-70]|uniref:Uncharacterized protein n=1 Tax=Sclerotinia sclerotiorum (strain ATCC 18683 / 1980 / Ss-1) TaxID=665079 RepID=A0A1D9QIL2_SCLS1|nr:hypothetical protein sscle_13g094890 [Sclerotinia sclerotiorum 1980 UF-70]